jgi:hypothetical protein
VHRWLKRGMFVFGLGVEEWYVNGAGRVETM